MTGPLHDQRLTFGQAIDRSVVYLIVVLVGWLCLTTLQLREQMAVLVERGSTDRQSLEAIRTEIRGLHDTDALINGQINELREQNLKHGWGGDK